MKIALAENPVAASSASSGPSKAHCVTRYSGYMTFQERLRKVIQRSVEGPAWHGPSVREAIDGLTAVDAASRPIPNLHTIWDIVLHTAAWMEEAAVRIEGGFNEQPVRGNFPDPGELTEENWQAARDLLASSLAQLIEAIVIVDMLAGAAEHNSYHAGQIMVLRKALDASSPA